jgi:predicted phosphodiesterase
MKVTSEDVDQAIALLAELPAEPAADTPCTGVDVLLDPERIQRARRHAGTGTDRDETTILFVSDTHLGYENRVKTGSGKTVSWASEISSVKTFKRIARITVGRDVDAVVHTGDILDHEVDQATLDGAESFLAGLSNFGVPVYCIIGSHDHDSANPKHPGSVDGITWLKTQVMDDRLAKLSTSPTPVAGGPIDAYGISAGNVGIDDVGKFYSREWEPSEIAFGTASPGPNILCLHDGVTPYRSRSDADVDLDELLAESRVSFDCVLVGDEHRPRDEEFYGGYTFESDDGTPVRYTGPSARISYAYRDHDAIVTELTFKENLVALKRHTL